MKSNQIIAKQTEEAYHDLLHKWPVQTEAMSQNWRRKMLHCPATEMMSFHVLLEGQEYPEAC